ncbi:hypothetical protein R3P38DRAFT_115465 [Favolaschia claudopus]|uniref:Uncharacterized protein n=1 Tax=Favolaschia claudopus TaxID=2862362 RepID=A0AAV9ZCS5_9AGAR
MQLSRTTHPTWSFTAHAIRDLLCDSASLSRICDSRSSWPPSRGTYTGIANIPSIELDVLHLLGRASVHLGLGCVSSVHTFCRGRSELRTRPHVALPWSQLTSLSLAHLSPDSCISILRQTQRLVHFSYLRLSIPHEPQNDPADNVDIVLLRLESLCFHISSYADISLFRRLFTPALHRLQLPEGFLGKEDPLGSLMAYISKSGCQLRKLEITQVSCLTENAYHSAFPSIPSIVVT